MNRRRHRIAIVLGLALAGTTTAALAAEPVLKPVVKPSVKPEAAAGAKAVAPAQRVQNGVTTPGGVSVGKHSDNDNGGKGPPNNDNGKLVGSVDARSAVGKIENDNPGPKGGNTNRLDPRMQKLDPLNGLEGRQPQGMDAARPAGR